MANKRKYGFPWWIKLATGMCLTAIIMYSYMMLEAGSFSPSILVVSMVAIVAVCVCYYSFEKSDLSDSYEELVDDIESEKQCIEQENKELRDVVKNLQSKPRTKKTKKEND